MDHNTQARQIADTILSNWRKGVWTNPNISKSVHLTKIDTSFPSPDGCFYEPKTSIRIAMEFKPEESEKQRGLLTGVGQCVAYLNRHGAAYLVAPNSVRDNPSMGKYLERTFKNAFYGKLPIGLITYDRLDFENLMLRCDISSRLRLAVGSGKGLDVNYWAAWRDTPPHAIYSLLKTAAEFQNDGNKSEKIWRKYYFGQYIVPKAAGTLKDVPSKIKMWDGVPQVPLRGIKQILRKKVEDGKMSEARALLELRKKTSSSGIDNHYRDIKKNHYNFINHLNLWDSEFKPTEYGKKFLEIGREHGGASKEARDFLGFLILRVGRHAELIEDVRRAIATSRRHPTSISDVRAISHDFLEGKGYIKTNPNRATTGVRKFLQSEFGLWGHLGVLGRQDGRYFDSSSGLLFDEARIGKLLAFGDKELHG